MFVYDRGNKLPNGDDRFLGMSTITPCLVNKRTVELIFPLQGRPGDDQEVTGDVRLQVTYSHSKRVSIKSIQIRCSFIETYRLLVKHYTRRFQDQENDR